MSTMQTAIARIRAWRKAEGISYRRLALDAGLSVNALQVIDEPTWNPTYETLQRLEALIPEDFAPTSPAEGEPDRAA